MPHKQTIVPLLDLVEPEASVVGAVNTVARNDGAWEGSSTDGKGFSTALLEKGRSLTDSRVTIIGTGGVAATLALRAAWDKALEVRILGRDKEKAARLAAMTNEITGSKIAVSDRFTPNSREKLPTDILINATPMGMSGTGIEFPGFVFMNGLEKGTLLCDLVYEPEETEFMAEGRRLGLETMGGFSMLVYQALEADRRFTGTGIARTKASRRAMESQKKKGTSI
jgi:shikimate dehydrogenase